MPTHYPSKFKNLSNDDPYVSMEFGTGVVKNGGHFHSSIINDKLV